MVAIRCSWIKVAVVAWIYGRIASASSSLKKSKSYPELHGLQPDVLVQTAPLVVAVACRDGVALVAAVSPSSASSSRDDEPLLYYNVDDEIVTSENATAGFIDAPTEPDVDPDDMCPFLDLPDSFVGPCRIQSISKLGATAFVSCGWKADGYIRLLNAARELASNERNTFGEESNSILPIQLSLFMAQCAVSERVRALSCAALVGYLSDADSTSSNESPELSRKHGCLWLVDVTGAYPVRAHSMGGGQVSIAAEGNKEPSIEQVADVINEELLTIFRQSDVSNENSTSARSLPYFNMTTEEGLEVILDIFSSKKAKINTPSGQLLHPGTRLELASVQFKSQRSCMIRRRVASVWGQRKRKVMMN
jgi:hypothetical protein